MIKVGISGGETPMAGELLRILMHHPDVEIVAVHSPANAGRPIASVHHGFIGEERLLFTSAFDATSLDMAFLLRPVHSAGDWSKLMADSQTLKVVLFKESVSLADGFLSSPVYGLSEVNRKPLVRGARTAILPSPLASLALIALYPIAAHLMLPSRLQIDATLPAMISQEADTRQTADDAAAEILRQLSVVQTSFASAPEITISPSDHPRVMSMTVEMSGSLEIDELFKLYDSIYDDHNFTFMVPVDVSPKEVAGTNKCIISLSKPSADTIRIRAVADAGMRGGAGEAVHLMNLLFGLYEKTGLQLKTSDY